MLSFEELKNEYKRIALSIHPDKNSHPKSLQAFQKLKVIYDETLRRKI